MEHFISQFGPLDGLQGALLCLDFLGNLMKDGICMRQLLHVTLRPWHSKETEQGSFTCASQCSLDCSWYMSFYS